MSSPSVRPRQTIPIGEYHAAYQIIGSGPPLILLHGFLGSGDNWQALYPDLANHYQCIALDLLGFGASSKPQLKYTIWHQIEFLHQFIRTLQLKEFHLAGHSYGGWLAAAYAIAATGIRWDAAKTQWQPSHKSNLAFCQPASLTLIAPAGIRDDSFVGRYNYMKPLLWETPVIDWLMAIIKPIAQITGQANAFRQIDIARVELQAQPVAKSFIVDRLRPEDAIDTVEQLIHHITIPTRIIAGGQDTTIPLWHCETYGQKIAASQFTVLADAEHDLLQTHSQTIAQLILQDNDTK
ncbi:alpha/beta hydrolase [filamentous cyanobacterium LEGE 11480]|uniref:Alpha/beta hydrolase n=1 Tax=Romeriopsis navalis LEGE 11480 TaxID=2777977 RepID=A0A928Z0D1_9CYAN|nr:alpha/beta hydrolase [Romeriopsis navalis]MBE9028141.1 alpha/beta hydrolase [Romeriopsis navalis LEGE 11480]